MPAASGEVLRRIAPAPSAISATLDARGATYGSFADNSRVAIGMLKVMEAGFATRKEPLADHEKNALIMIIEKMSRIITGKPHEDNWIDLGGYAELGRKPR
jgi:hypothetical protein